MRLGLSYLTFRLTFGLPLLRRRIYSAQFRSIFREKREASRFVADEFYITAFRKDSRKAFERDIVPAELASRLAIFHVGQNPETLKEPGQIVIMHCRNWSYTRHIVFVVRPPSKAANYIGSRQSKTLMKASSCVNRRDRQGLSGEIQQILWK
jgi:hypothetical protein